MEDYEHVDTENSSRSSFNIGSELVGLKHEDQPTQPKRKRGRPRKNENKKTVEAQATTDETKKQETEKRSENMNNQALIDKLTEEKQQIKDKTLRLADKLINPIGIPETQIKLMKMQFNTMMNQNYILGMRIEDLQK